MVPEQLHLLLQLLQRVLVRVVRLLSQLGLWRELLDRHEINALGLFVVGAQWGESHYYLAEREAVLDEA